MEFLNNGLIEFSRFFSYFSRNLSVNRGPKSYFLEGVTLKLVDDPLIEGHLRGILMGLCNFKREKNPWPATFVINFTIRRGVFARRAASKNRPFRSDIDAVFIS